MKKTALILLFFIMFNVTGFAYSMKKSTFQNETYTIYDEIKINGENIKQNYYDLPFDIPADKIVVIAFMNLMDESGKVIPENIPHYTYTTTYIGLKTNPGGRDVLEWTGGYSNPSRIRYFRTTEKQNGRFTVNVGLEHIAAYSEYPEFTWKYALSIKILEAVEFEPLDSLGQKSGEYNFFISSGPESIKEENFYSPEKRQNLCRAPINGNCNIYWSHVDRSDKNPYFGILLTNEDEMPVTITINSFGSYSVLKPGEAYTEIYTRMFEHYARKEGEGKKQITVNPGQNKWLWYYRINSFISGETTGIINLSVNGGEYTGDKLICTTYAFESEDYIDFIEKNAAYWEDEAVSDATGMRGSGNGAVLNLTGEKQALPFETVLAGENMINKGENILLKRSMYTNLYTGDDKGSYKKIKLDENGELPDLSFDDRQQLNSYNSNFGTIYKFDVDKLDAGNTLKNNKKVTGKIKFSARTTGILSQYTRGMIYAPVLNMTVWRTKNGVVDYVTSANVSLARNKGIYPLANDILFPFRNYEGGEKLRGEEGVYWEFDSNVPCYDDDNEYSYFVVGGGLSFLPFEISFDYDIIKLKEEPYTIYYKDKDAGFDEEEIRFTGDVLMAPLRKTAEILGAEVYYDDGDISAFNDKLIINLKQNSDEMKIYNLELHTSKTIKMKEKAVLYEDKIAVPLRDLCEAMGSAVDFYEDKQAVFIK